MSERTSPNRRFCDARDGGASVLATIVRQYGAAIRGDWGGIDGRVVQSNLDDIAAAIDGHDAVADWDLYKWRDELGVCPSGKGHWIDYCSGGCPAEDGDDT